MPTLGLGTYMVLLSPRNILAGIFLLAAQTIVAAQTPSSSPTFDCSRASSVLAVMICKSDEAAAADWELSSASWSYRYMLPASARERFDSEQDQFFASLTQTCRLPPKAGEAATSKAELGCIADAYRKRATTYRASLSGDALAESRLPAEQLKKIQASLTEAGLFTGTADGIFGSKTRVSIVAWQSKQGFAQTGFLTADQRKSLLRLSPTQPSAPSAVVSEPPVAPQPGPQSQAKPTVSTTASPVENTSQKPQLTDFETTTVLSSPFPPQGFSAASLFERIRQALLTVVLLAIGFTGFILIRQNDRARRALLELAAGFKSSPRRSYALLTAFVIAIGLVAATGLTNVRSIVAVPAVARHIPLNAQTHIVVPRFGEVLSALSEHVSESAAAADGHRLSHAFAIGEEAIADSLNTLRQLVPVTMLGDKYLLPDGCLDFTTPSDRRETGLVDETGLGWFSARSPKNWSNFNNAILLGPVDLDRFSNYLANLNRRFIVSFSVANGGGSSRDIQISADLSAAKLCAFDGKTIRKLSSGTLLRINANRPRTLALIEPSTVANIPPFGLIEPFALIDPSTVGNIPPLNLKCRIQNAATPLESCRCEIYAFYPASGDTTLMGDCQSADFSHSKLGDTIKKFILADANIGVSQQIRLPYWGFMEVGKESAVRWHASTQTLVLGPTELLDNTPVGTDEATDSSLVRDDTFIAAYAAMKNNLHGFLAAARPDSYAHSAFNRLITLPIVILGSLDRNSISVQAKISFEPLDAAILQEISRPGSTVQESELPLDNNLGALSLRVGDGKIGEYVRFADQYILDRLIEGVSTLDTADPDVGSRLAFARYLFRKIKSRTSDDQSEQSIAQNPHQVIVLENEENAWSPSVAVAVKFANLNDANSFVCREQEQIASDVHARIIMNAARYAKSKVGLDIKSDQYSDKLKEQMKLALGEKVWANYLETYDIDPVRISVRRKAGQSPLQNCGTSRAKLQISGVERDIYVLSPELFENSKRYYFRVPELEQLKTRIRDDTERDYQIEARRLEELRQSSALLTQLIAGTRNTSPATLLSAQVRQDIGKLDKLLSTQSIGQVAGVASNHGELLDKLNDLNLAETLDSKLKEKSNVLAALRKKQGEEIARTQRIIDGINRNEQRIAAYFDGNARILYIANNTSTLRRVVTLSEERNSNSENPIGQNFSQRVKFFATGDGTIQWILDLNREWERQWEIATPGFGDPKRWRDARPQGGRLLPWHRTVIGVAGEHNGITASVQIIRQAKSGQTP